MQLPLLLQIDATKSLNLFMLEILRNIETGPKDDDIIGSFGLRMVACSFRYDAVFGVFYETFSNDGAVGFREGTIEVV